MKKTLLLLFALLTLGVSGAWAASPAPGAYPLEGKTYYLFANKYSNPSSTDRYYLYWDNTNSVLKRADANSKENNDFYKWTVTVSDGKYYITNVGTGTKLAWDDSKGLTLNAAGTLFDLSKQVHYSACVSIYNPYGFWCCVQNSSETFGSGLRFSSSYYPSDSNAANYSLDFVFEEVLSAHSLTDGSYYTIYCDNDNKQYLYDNAGTLAQTSSAPASDLRYVWQCIVNGDYYNFRNLQTGKYLSHKVISSSANNFTIETTNVYHEGCAKLKTSSTYMGFTTAGAPDQASASTYPKVTTGYSFDFRFDAIDLSSWCTGDLLGGSISGTNNWTNTWTSGTSPSFTLTASANNINHKNDRTTGGLDIRSGTAENSTYSITAPAGYLVTGYKIAGYALNGNQTVTPSKGGVATVFTAAGNSISVSGLRQGKASFTLSGANDGLFIRALQVSLAPIASSITSLPTTNDKTYIIYNARAAWNFANNATSMNAVAVDLDDEKQQIALIYHNENYYLYSINAGKYLTANNTLTSVVTDNEQISITATGNDTYPWFFSFKNVANKNINIDGNPAVRINNHSTLDEGNQNAIIEADDFDETEALAMFNNSYVTYNLSYGGNSTFRTENNVVVAIGGDPADYVPEEWKAAYCTLTYDVETIEESTATVNVTMTWGGPFDFSTDFASAVWYYMQINRDMWLSAGSTSEGVTSVVTGADLSKSDVALWAFIGNPCDGVKIINKSIGEGYYGQAGDPFNISSADENTLLTIVKDEKKGLMFKNSAGKYMELLIDNEVAFCYDTPYDGGNTNIITLRSYYCQKFIDDVYDWADDNHRDEYFGPSETSLTTLTGNVATLMSNMSKTIYDGFTIPDDILSDIVLKYPTTGYYRIKNNGTGNYLAYGTPTTSGGGARPAGLIATSNSTDAASVIYLNGSANTVKLSSPGLHIQSQTEANVAFPGTSSTGVDFVFTSAGKNGVVSITNAASAVAETSRDGSLHEATENWGVHGVVNWDASAANSKWVIEKATSVTLTLNDGKDGYYYATGYWPFDVTITNADAFTLAQSGSYLVPTAVTGNNVPAGTPVLLKGASATANATINTGLAFSALGVTNALTGTYTGTTINGANDYVLGINNGVVGFYHWNSNNLGANRAYLDTPAAGVKGFVIKWGDETGITETTEKTETTKAMFDLSGRRVSKAQKGLYIQNGKKVMVK